MPITIYGTDWCDDTRRTRAFLAARGLRPKFVDIDARPGAAQDLSVNGRPISIPVVVFDDGLRLNDPTVEELEAALDQFGLTVTIRHRTKLNQEAGRFEQFRNDQLVASADFAERDDTIIIVGFQQHEPQDSSIQEENIQRLTSGLVEIIHQAGRKVDIDFGFAPTPPAEVPPIATPDDAEQAGIELESEPAIESVAAAAAEPQELLVPEEPSGTSADRCPLTQQFNELWSSGVEHHEAARVAREQGYSRLAIIKGLHALWEMPLTPEAMSLAFGEPAQADLAAMFHVLGWIVEQNSSSTMSEFQAFDEATGVSVKTQALSMAKRPRDTIAIVDRMGPGLHLRTIDENRAREMAAATIRESDGLLRIQDQSTLRMSFGWIFLYQSTEFMESGDYSKMISGNAPLLVDRFTGALWITDTAERPAAYAENYLATGNPLTPTSAPTA